MNRFKLKKINFGPLTIMIFISLFLAVLSFILNKIGLKGIQTDNNTLETTIVTVRNILSSDGIKYILGNSLKVFKNCEPLIPTIVTLITISIMEVSGLFKHLFGGLKNVKSWVLTAIILFVCISSTIIGNYSYAIIFPVVAALYKSINKDPKAGIMTAFIGITIGYGAGIVFNYQDILLGDITKISAVNIIDNYKYNPLTNIFVMIAATIIITIVGTVICENKFEKKTKHSEEVDELVTSKVALRASLIAFAVMFVIMIWSIIPGLPLSGWMLDNTAPRYMLKLLGDNAPFKDGIIFILLCMALVCSYIYGKLSRNIKDSREYNKAISKTFQNTGFIFAGLFFASIMNGILEWTNISKVISLILIEFVGNSQMSGVFVIAVTLLVTIIITILNPNTIYNWRLASPILVTSLARANISPSFTLMIFKAGDSIGKCFSPFYIYFILMLGFLYKSDMQNEDINFFGTMKKIFPVVLALALTWIIIIIGWNLIGLPTGINGNSVL